MLIQQAVVEYLRFLQYEKRFTEQTLSSQRRRIGLLTFRWLNKLTREITLEDICAFKRELIDRGCSPGYINNYIFITRCFFRYLKEEKHLPVLEFEKLRILKVPPPQIDYLEKCEVKQIIDSIPENEVGLRDQAIIRALLSSGARISELLNLNRDSVHFEEDGGWATVLGKGNQTRIIYFTEWATKFIKAYLESRHDDCEALFVSESVVLEKKHKRLKPEAVRRRLKKHGAGLGKRLYNHLTRKTFATNIANNGCPIDEVSKLLGHKNLLTTIKHYRGIGEERLKSEHHKFSNY